MEIVIAEKWKVHPLDPRNWTVSQLKPVLDEEGSPTGETKWVRLDKFFDSPLWASCYIYQRLMKESPAVCHDAAEVVRAIRDVNNEMVRSLNGVFKDEKPVAEQVVEPPVPARETKSLTMGGLAKLDETFAGALESAVADLAGCVAARADGAVDVEDPLDAAVRASGLPLRERAVSKALRDLATTDVVKGKMTQKAYKALLRDDEVAGQMADLVSDVNAAAETACAARPGTDWYEYEW